MGDPKTALRAAAILLRLAAPKRLSPASSHQLTRQYVDELFDDTVTLPYSTPP